jgi:hypothetical protein
VVGYRAISTTGSFRARADAGMAIELLRLFSDPDDWMIATQ